MKSEAEQEDQMKGNNYGDFWQSGVVYKCFRSLEDSKSGDWRYSMDESYDSSSLNCYINKLTCRYSESGG